MRGGAACLGGARVTAASGPRAAEDEDAGRAPPVARALLGTDTGGATAPQAAPGRRPRSIGGSQKPKTCQPHSPSCDVHAEPRQEQGRRGRASAPAAAASSTTSAREPGAGGGREARAPVGRGRGAVRTAGTNGSAASGLRGRGIPLEAGRGPKRQDGVGPVRTTVANQSAVDEIEGGAGAVPCRRPGAEVQISAVCSSVNLNASALVKAPAWGTQAYATTSSCTSAAKHCSPASESRERAPRRSETKT